jgi:hypothetical protein
LFLGEREGNDQINMHDPVNNLTESMKYVASRQKSRVPFTPVRGKREFLLFAELTEMLLGHGIKFSAKKHFKKWRSFGTNVYSNIRQGFFENIQNASPLITKGGERIDCENK